MERKLGARIFMFGLEVLKPILVPLLWVLESTYALFFRRRDIRASVAREEQFRTEILGSLPFLFDKYGGRFCSYESATAVLNHPRPFKSVITMVAFREFSVLFARGRGDFSVRIAPNPPPALWRAWEDLAVVLNLIDEKFERREFSSPADLAPVLEPRMHLLLEALSPARYSELLPSINRAHEYDRAIIRQWETEINRRLYPDK
jgi:hypothetical protein